MRINAFIILCSLTSAIMSAATPHSVYEDPRNPSSFLSEPHSFYSSDGTTTEPLWNGDAHITSPSDLSGLFVDSGNLNWPEVDSTDYSPGTYSDSDRQTGFSSGLSSNSSPDDFLELQAEYSQYENGPVSLYKRGVCHVWFSEPINRAGISTLDTLLASRLAPNFTTCLNLMRPSEDRRKPTSANIQHIETLPQINVSASPSSSTHPSLKV